MASVTMSTIAIVVAIAAFIFLSMKGVGPLITAVLAAAFVSLFTEAGFVQSFFTDFLSGVTSMVGNMFFLLVLGAIFGGVLSATGASEKIGTTFVRVMGPTNFLYALIAATMLLAATGAVPYVLMAYISFGVMRAANLPRYIAMAAVSGTMVLSQNVLPGCTTLNNLICSAPLGVDLYSAPLIGIATGVFAVLLNVFFLLYLVKDARKKGIGYEPMPNEGSIQLREEDDLPSFWASFFPVIFLIAFCFVLIVGFKVNATQPWCTPPCCPPFFCTCCAERPIAALACGSPFSPALSSSFPTLWQPAACSVSPVWSAKRRPSVRCPLPSPTAP